MQNKIAKYSAEIEDAVIGELLLEPHELFNISKYLKPECFYQSKNKEIYKAILTLSAKNLIIDILTITQELKRTSKLESIGGAFEVSRLTNRIASSGNIETHAMMIYQFYLLREMAGLGMKLYNLCNEPAADSLEILNIIQRDLSNIDFISKSNVQQVGNVAADIILESKKVLTTGVKPGITIGMLNADKYFSKQKQDLGILAARPGMGKTAMMLAMAKHTGIVLKKPVGIFSLEMSTIKLVGRMMASEANYNAKEISQKTFTSENDINYLWDNVATLYNAPIYIDDTAFMDIISFRAKVRRMITDFKIEEFYIDYLQLMSGGDKKGNREQEISFISRQLKLIAKQENITITALSQLSRDVEKRNNKKPQLSDLRESGAIEQDADWVLFLFRPEYYGIGNENNGLYEDETFDGKKLYVKDLLILESGKYREGALFKSALKFHSNIMKIENYDLNPNSNQFPVPLKNNSEFLKDII